MSVVGQADAFALLKPKAIVCLNAGYAASDELRGQLLAHCAVHLAMYKCPRWIEFVDTLPKTSTGKIQRFKLRD